MLEFFRRAFSGPQFEDENKSRSARLLNAICLSFSPVVLALLLVQLSGGQSLSAPASLILILLLVLFTASFLLNRRGYVAQGSLIVLTGSWLALAYLAFSGEGVRDIAFLAEIVVIIAASLLMSWQVAVGFALASVLAGWGLAAAENNGILSPTLYPPFEYARDATAIFLLASILIYLSRSSLLDTLRVAKTSALRLVDSNRRLHSLQNELENRVESRTAELAVSSAQATRRARQLQAVAEVARTIASLQDLDQLLGSIAGLISEQFGYYHVGIFLLDENREFATLRAANSEGGQRMLARGHQLRLEATSIVGYAAIFGKSRIASDVGGDSAYLSNPDLSETRSEVALPLIVGGRPIGILDVQSTAAGAFGLDDIEVLGTLAYQAAVAIENARLFGETRRALTEAQDAYQQFVGQAWSRFAQQRNATGYRSDGGRAARLSSPIQNPLVASALTSGDLSTAEPTAKRGAAFALPIKLRDQVIGVLHIQAKDLAREWTPDEMAIARAAAERAALALENARLLADSQKRAAKEKVISEATAHISSALNVENILHTTTNELARALGSAEIVLQLSPEDEI
jgi:GAF domain-containing protein